MYDLLSAMMGTFVAIASIAIVICIVIILKLLAKLKDNQKEIDKIRRENSELWSTAHGPFIKKLQEKSIEDGM